MSTAPRRQAGEPLSVVEKAAFSTPGVNGTTITTEARDAIRRTDRRRADRRSARTFTRELGRRAEIPMVMGIG